jgi:hypothetical protein
MITCPYVQMGTACVSVAPNRLNICLYDPRVDPRKGQAPLSYIGKRGWHNKSACAPLSNLFLGLDGCCLGFRFDFQGSALFRLGFFCGRNDDQQFYLTASFFNGFNRSL